MSIKPNVLPSPRLNSLDALRGFDMLWIIGADEVVHSLDKATGSPFWHGFAEQLTHPRWHGFAAYDLIFPLFIFLAGVSTPYSVGRELEKGKSHNELLWRVVKRGLILIALGMIYNNGLQIRPLSDFRFPSVLGKIGATYLFANIIYLYAKPAAQIAWFWGLLIGYWLLLKFSSAPGFPMGDLTEPGNFMSYLDRSILPGKLSRGIHDTCGLICTIPGISSALLGIFAGKLLQHQRHSPSSKALRLFIGGIACITLALIWNFDFPINKNLWSSSFVALTGGISLVLLSVFYYIIDVRGYLKWSFFFRVIGMNSILIYLSSVFIDWPYTASAFFKWLEQLAGNPFNVVVLGICIILTKWVFLYMLYKKKVFLKV